MSASRRAFGGLVVAIVIAHAAGGRAQHADTVAQVLFSEGRRLMKEGNYAAACPKLAESHRLDPGGGTVLNLALCYEATGRIASSWTTFKEALGLARKDHNAEREEFIRAKISALEPRLPTLTIRKSPGANVSGVRITRDTTTLGTVAWDLPLPVDPGEHTVVAHAPGYQRYAIRVTIRGEADHQELVIPALTELRSATQPPGEQARSGASNAQRATGFVVAGVGIAAVIAGAVFGAQAIAKKGASDELCGNDSKAETCAPGSDANGNNAAVLNDDARLHAKLANGFIFGGIGLVAVGNVVVVTAQRVRPRAAAVVLPAIDPRGAAMRITLRF